MLEEPEQAASEGEENVNPKEAQSLAGQSNARIRKAIISKLDAWNTFEFRRSSLGAVGPSPITKAIRELLEKPIGEPAKEATDDGNSEDL